MANEKTKKMSRVRILTECAVLLALGTVLSFVKLADLPAGGSVTCASMMPLVILAWRHGWKWGLGCGVVWGAVQQLVGLGTLSYVTTWQSVVAVILLDYVVAFAVLGLAGVFRGKLPDGASMAAGALLGCALRYACHVISGATVWAGLSIPTEAALIYSFSYNATYMVPETVILVLTVAYIGSALDFTRDLPVRRQVAFFCGARGWLNIAAGLALLGGAVFDTLMIFTSLQNPESGEFDITRLGGADWGLIGIVTGACVLVAAVLFFIGRALGRKMRA